MNNNELVGKRKALQHKANQNWKVKVIMHKKRCYGHCCYKVMKVVWGNTADDIGLLHKLLFKVDGYISTHR